MTATTQKAPASVAVELHEITKTYPGPSNVAALAGVSLTFHKGTFNAVMGPSGSGKSTLLHCAAGLDRPTSGAVTLAGTNISALKEPKLTKVRRAHVGFVFQSFNLIDALTVWQNVLLPQRLAGENSDKVWVREVLRRVGLTGRENAKPGQLSGGQRQRVALARALAARPDVIFADEPTGALDLATGREVLALLRQSVDELEATVVMVTHDPAAAAWADQVVFLADGKLAGALRGASAEDIAAEMTHLAGRG